MSLEKRRYEDRRDYLINAVSKRRKVVRAKALEFEGGKCEMCGYLCCEQALEFHHEHEGKKAFGISAKGYTRSWRKVENELRYCILVCANCHREIHTKMQLSREIEK